MGRTYGGGAGVTGRTYGGGAGVTGRTYRGGAGGWDEHTGEGQG